MLPEVQTESAPALVWLLDKLAYSSKPAPKKLTQEQMTGVRSREMALWQQWKDGGQKPEDLKPLLSSFKPLISSRLSHYKNRVEIPTSVLEHRHKLAFVKALKTYDPTRGAALRTHIVNHLIKVGRYVESNKNVARISENVSRNIGAFNAMKSELTEQLGHEPDAHAIHDYALKTNHPKLGRLSLKEIIRLSKEQHKALTQASFESGGYTPPGETDFREEEVKLAIWPQLTDQERIVYEYTFGMNGKPQSSPGQIVKRTGLNGPKVAKLRTSIMNKMRPHLQG